MKSAALPEGLESIIPSQVKKARAYSAYRPTTVWGLDSLPAHWREKPLKRVIRINTDKLPDSTDPDHEIEYVDIGNVTLEKGITSTERLRFETAPSRARRLVREGDTIVSTVRTYLKAVAQITMRSENLVVSTGFAVLRAGSELDPGYLYRLIQSEAFVGRIMAHSVGVSYPAINASDIGSFSIQIPPLDEQRAIAKFLDHETAQLDQLISKNETMLQRLDEARLIFVSRAVNIGINSDAALIQSTIPWLGRIPAHWKIKRLKHFIKQIEQGWSPQCENRPAEPGEWGVLKVGCMNSGVYDEAENKALPSNVKAEQHYEVHIGDVLMSRSNTAELVGAVGRVRATQGHIMVCDKLYRIAFAVDRLNPDYAIHLLRSISARQQIERDATGASASMKNISNDRVENLLFAIPDTTEQATILAHIEARTKRIDCLIGGVKSVLARLKQYRAALISTAVTGEIDVCNYRPEAICQ